MNTPGNIVFLSRVLVISLLCAGRPYTQDVKEISVSGGLMYSSWVESHNAITCGLYVQAPAAVPADRFPLQVVVVIDASREMEGAAMQNAKTSAANILEKLHETDMFGVITYSKFARVVLPLQPLNPTNRKNAAAAIGRIKYDPGRNLSDGFAKGFAEFARFKGQRSAGQHLLLFTNGEPVDGVTDLAPLEKTALGLAREHNVTISTFGYDRFYHEDFLIVLARNTDGRAYFIEEEKMAETVYPAYREVKRIMETVAVDLRLSIVPPPGSTLTGVYGGTLEKEVVVIGKAPAGMTLPVIFDITGRPARRKEMVINVDYLEPVRLGPRKSRIYLDVPLRSGDPVYDEKYAPELIEFLTMRDLAESIEEIRGKEKNIRVSYALRFRDKVKELEQVEITLRSDYFSECVRQFKQLQRDIENAAIEENLLIKRIKYRFLEMQYGK